MPVKRLKDFLKNVKFTSLIHSPAYTAQEIAASTHIKSFYREGIEFLLLESIIVRTREIKSLLPSLCKREEFSLFGKEGLGEISGGICLFNYGLLSKSLTRLF